MSTAPEVGAVTVVSGEHLALPLHVTGKVEMQCILGEETEAQSYEMT